MPKISKRTIGMIAKLLELGYTRDRINLFFQNCEVPSDILKKHSGGKEVYSAKVMYELYDINSENSNGILKTIANDILLARGSSPPYFLHQTGFFGKLNELKLSLENDGFKFINNKLIPIIDEDFEQEENLLKRELKKLNLKEATKYLDQSYDNFISRNWEPANSMTRNTLEYVTTEIAKKISEKESETPNLNRHKAVRRYLREKLLDENESNILTFFMHWCSNNGSHPGMSDENECRLRRIFTISLCQYYLEKYQNEYP